MTVLNLRMATSSPSDIEMIMHQRKSMFLDMGYPDDDDLNAMCEAYTPWVKDKIDAGEYVGWFAEEDNKIIGGGALLLYDWMPRIGALNVRRGYLLNIYVESDYRRRGIAREVITQIMNWARGQGITTVTLHASEKGRPLYESLGFTSTNEMRINLD